MRFALFFLLPLLLLRHKVASSFSTKETGFISCADDPCQGGDVNYELTASVRIMKLINYTYAGRTYSSSGDSLMGPTIRVQPGQSLWIKLHNNLSSTLTTESSSSVSLKEYWNMLQNPGEKIKYPFYKPAVSEPDLMQVDEPNIPHHFDNTNLHLHGLDVQVHMFDPVNTHNPDAQHVAVQPGECYCYRFDVPSHHPGGLYWYHPHLHGSTAVQLWGGMMGLLYVEGPLEKELVEKYDVTRSFEFVIWDPALKAVHDKSTHNLEVDDFLKGQTTLSKIHPFLVNGKLTPDFTVPAGQILHLRCLCATIENENTFIVYKQGEEHLPWDSVAFPFWVIGSDGVTYERPRRKTVIVMAGGQREEILIQLEEPGTYVISQQEQALRTCDSHPGTEKEESIKAEDIVSSENIVFSMGTDRDKAPFPQYYVNGLAFDPDRLDFFASPGEAREYILINANHNAHPFHIHVNRFQIQEMGSELSSDVYPVLTPVLDFDPTIWRDTVMVPPNGRTRIWVQYKNYTGKTVFHCHFLAHEDTGMMSTLFIGVPKPSLYRMILIEHWELLLGFNIGITAALLAAYLSRGKKESAYRTVPAMNELKAKVLD